MRLNFSPCDDETERERHINITRWVKVARAHTHTHTLSHWAQMSLLFTCVQQNYCRSQNTHETWFQPNTHSYHALMNHWTHSHTHYHELTWQHTHYLTHINTPRWPNELCFLAGVSSWETGATCVTYKLWLTSVCVSVCVLCMCVTHDVCGNWVVVPPAQCRLIVLGCVYRLVGTEQCDCQQENWRPEGTQTF